MRNQRRILTMAKINKEDWITEEQLQKEIEKSEELEEKPSLEEEVEELKNILSVLFGEVN